MNDICQEQGCEKEPEFHSFHECDPDGVTACRDHLGGLLGFTCGHELSHPKHKLPYSVFSMN